MSVATPTRRVNVDAVGEQSCNEGRFALTAGYVQELNRCRVFGVEGQTMIEES